MSETKQPLARAKGADRTAPAAAAPQTIKFTLDGREVEAPAGETIFRTADRYGIKLPHLCYAPEPGYRPDGNCRVCMVEIEGERVLAASCIRTPTAGMKVNTQTDRAQDRAADGGGAAAGRPARPRSRPRSAIPSVAGHRRSKAGHEPGSRRAQPGGARPQPHRHGGQSRRLHPVQSVRPRLPRSAGQRRHRHGRPRPCREDRVRLRRSHGRLDLRRLRGMRAGLPDRRADAGAARSTSTTSAPAFPTARSIRCVPIAASAASSPTTSRTTSCSTSAARTARRTSNRLCVKGRFGFDYVHNPQRLTQPMIRKDGVPKHVDDALDARQCAAPFPPRHLGGGARPRSRRSQGDPRQQGRARARRIRLGQGLERGGLSVPEAGPHRLRLQQRRSLHPAVPRLVGGGAAGRRRLRGGDGDLQRVQELRRHHRDRRQPDGEPSRRGDLLQAGGQARRQAHRDGPARPGAQAPRRPHAAVHQRHRRGDAQRHAQRDRHREALRPAIRPDLHRRLFAARRARQGVHAGTDGADLRHRCRHAAHRRAHLCPRRVRDHLLGHGHFPAHPRHRQCALPDRAVADLRPGRPARHRAPSAARPEQRAGRLRRRPDPDVLSRLRVGRERPTSAPATRPPGAPRSIPRRD